MSQDINVAIIGSGLVGAYYAKRLLLKDANTNIYATIRDLRSEQDIFERRVFDGKLSARRQKLIEFNGADSIEYLLDSGRIILSPLDIFEKEGDNSSISQYFETISGKNIALDHVVNSINLGTIFGLRELRQIDSGNQRPGFSDVFDFCMDINNTLIKYVGSVREKNGNNSYLLKHLLVSTTGTGGIGLERLKISHNLSGVSGVPPSVILKSQKASEIIGYFRDFRRSNEQSIVYSAVVPACAIIGLEVYNGNVRPYGEYAGLTNNKEAIPLFRPEIILNGERIQELKDLNEPLNGTYGLFGEDGPHTIADLQQLELFMGVTTATKIAEIIDDTLNGSGAYDYNFIGSGQTVPEQSEYSIFAFEHIVRSKYTSGSYVPITLSPIAPFDISINCFVYELLDKAGYSILEEYAGLKDDKIDEITERVIEVLKAPENEMLLNKSTSLGVEYDIQSGGDKFKAVGPFSRGILTKESIVNCINYANDFLQFKKESSKANDFFEAYATYEGIYLSEIIGYLAAFPVAQDMRKQGHF